MNKSDFFTASVFAIAGVSRNPKKFSGYVFKKLISKGFTVYPINPKADAIEGQSCYASVTALPSEVKHLIIMTPATECKAILDSALERGITNIWVQQGVETKELMAYAKDKEANIFFKSCLMMYANPVGMHRFHRFLTELFGSKKK